MSPTLFHLSFPVNDISQTKKYYVDGLGCGLGRENEHSVILNLYGHQLVAHVTDEVLTTQRGIYPRHFGLVFTDESDWQKLLERAQQKQLSFYQKSKQRFVGTPLEHRTFFLVDPFFNLMEYKYYARHSAIFGDREFAQIGDPSELGRANRA
ncbi:MAG: glyoxalase [Myxacorys californica WJT36-NPBG1]|nr:glyoxalase [Myxacorys californica WJT36-NPBG1]